MFGCRPCHLSGVGRDRSGRDRDRDRDSKKDKKDKDKDRFVFVGQDLGVPLLSPQTSGERMLSMHANSTYAARTRPRLPLRTRQMNMRRGVDRQWQVYVVAVPQHL